MAKTVLGIKRLGDLNPCALICHPHLTCREAAWFCDKDSVLGIKRLGDLNPGTLICHPHLTCREAAWLCGKDSVPMIEKLQVLTTLIVG